MSSVHSPPATAQKRVALVSLSGEKEFRKVRQHGVVVRHPLFTLRLTSYRPRYGEVWQPRAIVGIVVSKKTLRRAVARNKVRRRFREALRTGEFVQPCRAVLHPTEAARTAPFSDLQSALRDAFVAALTQANSSRAKSKPKDKPGQSKKDKPAQPRSGQSKASITTPTKALP